MSDTISRNNLACDRCGETVLQEFTVPSPVWNAVVRRGGPEQPSEYICEQCYRIAVAEYVMKNEGRLSPAPSPEAPLVGWRAAVKPLIYAAEGLSYGDDWNNGTHAKMYRPRLLDALPAALAALRAAPCPKCSGTDPACDVCEGEGQKPAHGSGANPVASAYDAGAWKPRLNKQETDDVSRAAPYMSWSLAHRLWGIARKPAPPAGAAYAKGARHG